MKKLYEEVKEHTGLTVTEIAQRAGLTRQTVYNVLEQKCSSVASVHGILGAMESFVDEKITDAKNKVLDLEKLAIRIRGDE